MKKRLSQMSAHKFVLLLCGCVLVLAGTFLILRGSGHAGGYALTVDKGKAPGIESEITVNVIVNHLGDALYPAASFVIEFDKARLELVSVNEGNILVKSENGEKAPAWSVNVPKANETGEIRIMYLDLSGGTEAFTGELAGENSTVFRLHFRVRGSARTGETYPLTVTDAVFAANDEKNSISMANGTLKIKNGSIEVEK